MEFDELDEFDFEYLEFWGGIFCFVDNFVLYLVVVVYVEDVVILENLKWESDTMLLIFFGFVVVFGIDFVFFFFVVVDKRFRSFKIEVSFIDMLYVLVLLFEFCWLVVIFDVSDFGEVVVLKLI